MSGDLRDHAYGEEQVNYLSFVALEDVYDILPQAVLRVPRIHIDFKVLGFTAAHRFIFALSCFLNSPGLRTEKLTIDVDMSHVDFGYVEDYEKLWYGLANMPAQIAISGTEWPACFHIWRGLKVRSLKDGHPHPKRSFAAALNTVAEYKRICHLVQPVVDQRRKAFEVQVSSIPPQEPRSSQSSIGHGHYIHGNWPNLS